MLDDLIHIRVIVFLMPCWSAWGGFSGTFGLIECYGICLSLDKGFASLACDFDCWRRHGVVVTFGSRIHPSWCDVLLWEFFIRWSFLVKISGWTVAVVKWEVFFVVLILRHLWNFLHEIFTTSESTWCSQPPCHIQATCWTQLTVPWPVAAKVPFGIGQCSCSLRHRGHRGIDVFSGSTWIIVGVVKNPLTFEIAMVGSLGWTTGSEGFFFKKKDVRMFFFSKG